MAIRVLIVADDLLSRAGLSTLLADQPGCSVVGQVGEGGDLPVQLEIYRPDVVVWDLGWDPAPDAPDWPALERLASLAEEGTAIVALLPDEAHAAEVWVAGARGLLLRNTRPRRLLAAVTAATHGLTTLDPALSGALLPQTDAAYPPPPVEPLTPREQEVLQLLAEGLPNKTIARRLNISDHTVKFHVNAILSKLNAQSRTEAVVRATRLGLILL